MEIKTTLQIHKDYNILDLKREDIIYPDMKWVRIKDLKKFLEERIGNDEYTVDGLIEELLKKIGEIK